ncbi:protein SPEAR1-like [Brassica napus]|uniref:Uncharacterized protein n=2 Tax=Brassica TaxID=3705 RepID=A0A8X7QXK3_BRACI|nr:protein SPEAR1-like [Brassica napus]KAG2277722.1 hypothetical protein Bca52824_060277 [Brassica carinata]VDD29085.1 unnamed protein product [Brassica oleracea]
MGSSFFGKPNMRGSSPSSSSPTSSSSSPATRRGKKNGSEKPKQPQRGLGVAQLEKIRLHSEMSCNSFDNYSSSLYPQENVRMQGYASIPSSSPSFTYVSPSPSPSPSPSYGLYPNMMIDAHRDQYERATMSWNPSYGILESHHYLEPNTTRHILNEDPCFTRRSKSLGSGNQNSGSNDNQELDLELRLSL